MLVLSRKKDEKIRIGEDIEITVVEIRGDKVRLGINAPAQVPIERDDIKDRTPKDRGTTESTETTETESTEGKAA